VATLVLSDDARYCGVFAHDARFVEAKVCEAAVVESAAHGRRL